MEGTFETEGQKLELYLTYIQQEGKENSIRRRNTLKLIYDALKVIEVKKPGEKGTGNGGGDVAVDGNRNQNDNESEMYVKAFPRIILSRLSDQIEKSRELSYEILGLLLSHMEAEDVIDILPYLVPKLVERLGQQELTEPSEEVRLIALQFIELLVEKMGPQLSVYIDDFLVILANTFVDDFYSVRMVSCKVVSDIAKSNGKVFHYNSERLIKPLCTSIAHQRHPVRLACVKCIGDVILYGNHKSIDLVIPHITQRLFDSTPQVRKAVIEVVGSWMISYVDRYSFFHKLLPLLLTGMGDESPDVVLVAKESWATIGLQYLEENIEEYKDQADYPTETPEHYPPNVERPNLGCRILACQQACKLIPGIGSEISDWILSTRIKSAQLMYNIILNSEEKITMHTEPLLQCLFKGSQDEDPIVLDCVFKSAELVGYFVPLSVTWPMLLSKIKSTTNDAGIAITASILKGTKPLELEEYLNEIVDLIKHRDICQSLKPKIQKRVLEVCSVVTDLPSEALTDSASGIFTTVLTVLAVTKDPFNSGRAYDLLKKLEKILGFGSFEELMGKYCGEILQGMKDINSEWTVVSPDKQVFDLIISHGNLAVNNNTEIILDIMVANLGPDKDPEVRLRFFTLLSTHLQTFKNSTDSQKEQLQNFVKHLIADVLDPNLTWMAGKTACALRSAAVACVHSILESQIINVTGILEMLPKLEGTLLGLVEDTLEITRVIACQSLRFIIETCERRISSESLHKIYQVMLKRFDDVSNQVRTAAALTIAAVFNNVPVDYDVKFYKVHLENVYSVLLVHLDDGEEAIQEVVFDTLCEIGKLLPTSLIEECEKMKMKHRSPDLCEKIIAIMKADLMEKKEMEVESLSV